MCMCKNIHDIIWSSWITARTSNLRTNGRTDKVPTICSLILLFRVVSLGFPHFDSKVVIRALYAWPFHDKRLTMSKFMTQKWPWVISQEMSTRKKDTFDNRYSCRISTWWLWMYLRLTNSTGKCWYESWIGLSYNYRENDALDTCSPNECSWADAV